MANPLQPKCLKALEEEYNAYVINVTASSKSGNMDIIACINGEFWGFEIKWNSDTPSPLQRQKINKCIDAGGRAYFIRSVQELRNTINQRLRPIYYDFKSDVSL